MVDTSGGENPQAYGLSDEQAQRIATRYGFSPSQFRQQSEQRQHRILSRIRFDDLPRQRAEFLALFHRGDDGRIAPDGRTRAVERLREMRSTSHGRVAGMSVGPLPETPVMWEHVGGLPADSASWTSLGPGNIGGRIRSILIDPSNTQKIYVGSVSGGIWITTDGGQNWQPADDLMANLAVCSMAMVPGAPSTIYAGTGEGFRNVDFTWGDGIFKTTDGGRVWQQLPNTMEARTSDFLMVNSIATNYDGSIVLAGTSTGLFRSTDGGATWSQRLSGVEVGNIQFDSTGSNCIAGMLFGGGTRYSTDGGSTWTQPTSYPAGGATIGRIQVCYAKANSTIVYASVETKPSGAQIWRSADGGHTFAKRDNPTDYFGGQGYYDNVIWAGDPTRPDFIIVGGIELYKSINGGNSLLQISTGVIPGSVHSDHHVIQSDPNYNGTSNLIVYFGNDGGLYKTNNVTTAGDPNPSQGWVNLNSKLAITQLYSVDGMLTTSGGISSIIGGAQDTGTLLYTPAAGANNWTKLNAGDGGYVACDAANSMYYGENVYLQIFRVSDTAIELICGAYGTSSGVEWKAAPYLIPDAREQKTLLTAPFVMDRSNSQRLLAGGESLWQTLNARAPNTTQVGPSWTSIKPPVAGALVSAIAISPARGARVLVGYSNGQICISDNATNPTPRWDPAESGIGANRMCTSLAIDKTDDSRMYATFAGFRSDNIWTSANSGSSWSNLGSSALPSAPIYCVTIHPQNPQWLYLGTEYGVFASEDGGQSWAPNNAGPANCRIYQLTWLGSTLCCASHGRGAFSIDLTIRQASLIVTGDTGGTVASFNGLNGNRVSTSAAASGSIFADPLIDGVSVYCAYEQPSKVTKFRDARNLAVVAWEKALAGGITATPCLVKAIYSGDPDVLYVTSGNGKLTALNAGNGNFLWDCQVMPSGTKAYSNQVMNQWIYIASDRGLYAVNTQTRMATWSQPYICKAPLLLAANTVFAGAQDGNVYSVDARTGSQNWSYPTGNVVGSTPVWVLGSIIVGNQSGKLVGLDYRTHAQQFELNFANEQIEAIAADGNVLYFAGNAQNGHLYAYRLDPATRAVSPVWSKPLTLGAASPPQIDGTTVYLTTMNRFLMAFNKATGEIRWPSPPLPRVALAAPALGYS